MSNHDGEPDIPINRRVMVAVQNADHSRRSLDWYFDNLMRSNDLVLLVHIIEVTHRTTLGGVTLQKHPTISGSMIEVLSQDIPEAEKVCLDAANKVKEHGVLSEVHIYAEKRAGQGLINAVEILKPDNLVMGTRRGSALFSGKEMDSVSKYVVQNVLIPVTVIPSALPAGKRKPENTLIAIAPYVP